MVLAREEETDTRRDPDWALRTGSRPAAAGAAQPEVRLSPRAACARAGATLGRPRATCPREGGPGATDPSLARRRAGAVPRGAGCRRASRGRPGPHGPTRAVRFRVACASPGACRMFETAMRIDQ